jgi:hypothetical protein
MIYTNDSAPRIERRGSPRTFYAHQEKGLDAAVDWRDNSNDQAHNNHRSNPFYVLRSARKAFENFQYLLPCLQSLNSEATAITMSDFGSIRQYKDKKVNGRVY